MSPDTFLIIFWIAISGSNLTNDRGASLFFLSVGILHLVVFLGLMVGRS